MKSLVRNLAISATLAMCLHSRSISGQGAANRGTLSKVRGAEADKLTEKVKREAPAGASIDVDPDQVFLLKAPGTVHLAVIPVMYQPHGKAEEPSQCGVYFVPGAGGASHYVPVVDVALVFTDMCQEVLGAGTMPDSDAHPRLIFLFAANSGHGRDYPLAYVLAWDGQGGGYRVDTKTSDWLHERKGSGTVAGVRALLSRRR